jgi:hypothetical protein
MVMRKLGRILLEVLAGLVAVVLLLLVAVKVTLDRAPRYQAEIKQWVHAQTGYHIGFEHVSPAFRWYGPELYFERFELRSKDDQRVLARAHGARIAADIWQLVRSGKLLAGRIEIDSPDITVARLGPDRFAVASEIELGGDNSSLGALNFDDLPAGNLLIRHAALTLQNWNTALPQLTLRDVNFNLRRGDGGLRARFTCRRRWGARSASAPRRTATPAYRPLLGGLWCGFAASPFRDGMSFCPSISAPWTAAMVRSRWPPRAAAVRWITSTSISQRPGWRPSWPKVKRPSSIK